MKNKLISASDKVENSQVTLLVQFFSPLRQGTEQLQKQHGLVQPLKGAFLSLPDRQTLICEAENPVFSAALGKFKGSGFFL